MKDEAKWDLLKTMQPNTEDWDSDKGKESGINYEYDSLRLSLKLLIFKSLMLKMVLILKFLLIYLKPLLLILMFLKEIGTSIMILLKTLARIMKLLLIM